VHEDDVRAALDKMPGEKVVQQYGAASAQEILVRLPQNIQQEEGGLLDRDVKAATAALEQSTLSKFEIIGTGSGRPGDRGAVAAQRPPGDALLHPGHHRLHRLPLPAQLRDRRHRGHVPRILVTLAFLAFFGYDLSLNVVAAILTITGYSVNDTIVIFDRVRENFRSMRRDSLEHVVNVGVNQTLGRTIITAGATC